MTAKFEFAPELELSILRLMARDLPFLIFSADLLKPLYFDTIPFQWYFTIMRNHYKDHRTLIDSAALKNEIKKAYLEGDIDEFNGDAYYNIYNALWDDFAPGISYIQKELTKFACKQAMIQAIKDSPDLLADEKFDEITDKINKANKIRDLNVSAGHQYFLEFGSRWAKMSQEDESLYSIPTGIPHLDGIMNRGGLSPKELGVVMAPPGRGKSNFLVHVGKRAVFAGKKVFHVTLEMSYEKISSRYDSAFSGINTKFVKSCLDNTEILKTMDPFMDPKQTAVPLRDRLARLSKIFGNALVIKEYPTRGASVSTVEADIEELRARGFCPDILLLDYADIMKCSSRYNSRWEEQGAIYEETRGLAVRLKIPIWTGCQANRQAMSKQIITLADVSDSFEKVKIADVVLGLCQTDEEKRDELMRIYVAKNRDAAGGQEILLRTDYSHMQFHKVSPEDFDPDAIAKSTPIIQSYRKPGGVGD